MSMGNRFIIVNHPDKNSVTIEGHEVGYDWDRGGFRVLMDANGRLSVQTAEDGVGAENAGKLIKAISIAYSWLADQER